MTFENAEETVNKRWSEKHILKTKREPPTRIELVTPGLQDQCSNHWAMEAGVNYYELKHKNQIILKAV